MLAEESYTKYMNGFRDAYGGVFRDSDWSRTDDDQDSYPRRAASVDDIYIPGFRRKNELEIM